MKNKLEFKKEVIANLENHEMKAINGAEKDTFICLKTIMCKTADCGCSKDICPTVVTHSCVESIQFPCA